MTERFLRLQKNLNKCSFLKFILILMDERLKLEGGSRSETEGGTKWAVNPVLVANRSAALLRLSKSSGHTSNSGVKISDEIEGHVPNTT